MRIISGSAKGLKLTAPEGWNTRPTADRLKESLFNIISAEIYDSSFLDIFSGTGSIGIEALSRGAKAAVFIEHDKDCIKIIQNNLQRARLGSKALILPGDFAFSLTELGRAREKFDIIFMDPPYGKGLVDKALEKISTLDLINNDGFIIAEQGSDEEIPSVEGLEVYDTRSYKTTRFLFIKKSS